MRTLRPDDFVSLAYGATFLGAGGGGTLSSTLEMIERWLPDGSELSLLSVEEAAAAAGLTVVSSFIGSQAANEHLTDISPAISAVQAMGRLMEHRLGEKVARTVPIELGVQSSAVPALLVATRLGLDAVDADGAGRAVPVLPATLYAELSTSPTVLTNRHASSVVVEEPDAMATNQVAVSVVGSPPFGGVAGLALWPMDGEALRRVIPEQATRGSLSLCLEVGAALRRGDVETGLAAIRAQGLDADLIVKTRLIERRTTVSDDHLIVTFEDEEGRRYLTYSVSENLVLWDADAGSPLVVAPDSLCYVTPEGRPLSNTELPEIGGEVWIVAVAARPAVLANDGIRRTFDDYLAKVGYPGPYRSFRHLLAASGDSAP